MPVLSAMKCPTCRTSCGGGTRPSAGRGTAAPRRPCWRVRHRRNARSAVPAASACRSCSVRAYVRFRRTREVRCGPARPRRRRRSPRTSRWPHEGASVHPRADAAGVDARRKGAECGRDRTAARCLPAGARPQSASLPRPDLRRERGNCPADTARRLPRGSPTSQTREARRLRRLRAPAARGTRSGLARSGSPQGDVQSRVAPGTGRRTFPAQKPNCRERGRRAPGPTRRMLMEARGPAHGQTH